MHALIQSAIEMTIEFCNPFGISNPTSTTGSSHIGNVAVNQHKTQRYPTVLLVHFGTLTPANRTRCEMNCSKAMASGCSMKNFIAPMFQE